MTWLEVFWWMVITVYGVRRVLSGDTRKPYLAGFLAAFVLFLALKITLQRPAGDFFHFKLKLFHGQGPN